MTRKERRTKWPVIRFLSSRSLFSSVCVVIRISKPQSPCYHLPLLYNDEDDTIGRQAHSTAIRGPHPNPAQIPNSNIRRIKKSLNLLKTNDKPKFLIATKRGFPVHRCGSQIRPGASPLRQSRDRDRCSVSCLLRSHTRASLQA
jgi:hypothetical protein